MNIYKVLVTLALAIQITFCAVAGQDEIDQLEQVVCIYNIVSLQTISSDLASHDKEGSHYQIPTNSMAWWLLNNNN